MPESIYGYHYPEYAKSVKCLWCFSPFSGGIGLRSKTKEHVIPLAEGSEALGYANWTGACKGCNNARRSDVSWRPYSYPPSEMPPSQREWLRQHLGPDFAIRERRNDNSECPPG